jgi:hypothetical protein
MPSRRSTVATAVASLDIITTLVLTAVSLAFPATTTATTATKVMLEITHVISAAVIIAAIAAHLPLRKVRDAVAA